MKDLLFQLVEYERWANSTVVDALASIAAPPERAVQVMGHILSVPQVWLSRLYQQANQPGIWQNIPVAAMREQVERNNQLLRAYLTNVSSEQLLATVAYQNSKGETFENTPQDILIHLSHHAAYHRGQVVQLIRSQLAEAPFTDYIFWVRTIKTQVDMTN